MIQTDMHGHHNRHNSMRQMKYESLHKIIKNFRLQHETNGLSSREKEFDFISSDLLSQGANGI